MDGRENVRFVICAQTVSAYGMGFFRIKEKLPDPIGVRQLFSSVFVYFEMFVFDEAKDACVVGKIGQ